MVITLMQSLGKASKAIVLIITRQIVLFVSSPFFCRRLAGWVFSRTRCDRIDYFGLGSRNAGRRVSESVKADHPSTTMKLHASGEDYLGAALILHQRHGMVRSVDLARHMGYSKPSISHAVGILRDGGFLTVDQDGCRPRGCRKNL